MNSNTAFYENVTGATEFSQSFYPTQNRLTQVIVEVGGYNFSGTATLTIKDPSNNTIVSSNWEYSNINEKTMWYFNSFPEATLVPGQPHKAYLSTTTDLYWYKSLDCDLQGYAVAQGFSYPSVDFSIVTSGYSVAGMVPAPEEEPAEPAPTTPSPTSTTDPATAPAPAATVDNTIKPATGLKTENVAGAPAPTVKLTWSKSATTDITGYKVFRSTKEKTGFTEVGKTAKAVLEYSDATVAASTKYYYFVRAYRNTSESASTSTVNITTEAAPVTTAAPLAEEAPTATADTSTPAVSEAPVEEGLDWMLIILIVLFVLISALVAFLIVKYKKAGKPIPVKLIAGLSALLVIIAGLTAYRLIGDSSSGTSATTEDKPTVTAPKHADWPVFEGKKYPFKLYYPADYTVTEGAGGNISINKGADIIGEIYSMDNAGDDAGMLTASGNLYKDETKGYMTGAVESSTVAAGVNAKKYTGTFGKNAGAKVMVHDGIQGSVVMFTQDGRTWEFFSYDKADPAAIAIFEDMTLGMSF